MAADLRDDGTMDTVVACSICGEEQRYTWDGQGTYLGFVDRVLDDFDEDHECPEDESDDVCPECGVAMPATGFEHRDGCPEAFAHYITEAEEDDDGE